MEIDSVMKCSGCVGSSESALVQHGVEAVFSVHATFQKMFRKLPTTSFEDCLKNKWWV